MAIAEQFMQLYQKLIYTKPMAARLISATCLRLVVHESFAPMHWSQSHPANSWSQVLPHAISDPFQTKNKNGTASTVNQNQQQ